MMINPRILYHTSFLRLLGILVICVGLSTFAATAQTLEITATQQVSEHWRGAYDILVRPEEAILDIEKQTGLVEGNYLGTPQGGITREQYLTIRNLPDVDVAAPVATVGFLRNDTGSLELDVECQPNMMYRTEVELDDTGQHRMQQQVMYFLIPTQKEGEPFKPFFVGTQNISKMGSRCLVIAAQTPVLWTLVAGIDPEQEEKLIDPEGTSFKNLQDVELLKTVDAAFKREATVIPLLVSNNAFLNLSARVRIETVVWNRDDLLTSVQTATTVEAYQKAMENLEAAFQLAPSSPVLDEHVSFADFIRPMDVTMITISSDHPAQLSGSGMVNSSGRNGMLYPGPMQYKLQSPLPSAPNQKSLQILAQGSWGEDITDRLKTLLPPNWQPGGQDVPPDTPLFRTMGVFEPPPFVFAVKGSYDLDRIANQQDPLSYVPLGIYEPPLATLRYNEQGQSVEPQVLSPGMNPAGFIPRPPLALTSLEAAQFFRGRSDFIDAIRIRVKGIEGYTPENVAKVERVASEIAERTGLHVDIVAGSSPQKVLVRVPGLGYVEERWTTLGTATKITGGINRANIVLLAVLFLTSGLFTYNAAQIWILSRRSEIGLLKALGWHTKSVTWHLLEEMLLLGLAAALLAALASLVLSFALGLHPNGIVISGVSLLAPLLQVVSAWLPIHRAVNQSPTMLLRQGEIANSKPRLPGGSAPFNMPGIAIRQLTRRWIRSGLSVLIIGTGVGMAILIFGLVIVLRGMLQVTLLGEFVSMSVRPYHVLMIATVLAMGVLATIENLLLSILERTQEFGVLRAVGWRTGHIRRLITWEGWIIGGIGGLFGACFGCLTFYLLAQQWTQIILLIAGGGVISAVALGWLAALYPAIRAQHLTPVAAIAGTGSQNALPEQPKRSTLRYSLFLLFVLLTLLGTAVIGGRKQIVQQAFGLGAPPQPTPHPAEALFSGKRAIDNVQHILEQKSTGREQADEPTDGVYLAQTFTGYGLTVERQVVVMNAVHIYQPDSQAPLLSFPGDIGVTRGIAAHFDQVQSGNPVRAKLVFKALDDPWPSAETVTGKILLVEQKRDSAFDEQIQASLDEYGSPPPYLAMTGVALPNEGAETRSMLRQDHLEASLVLGENVIAHLPGTRQPEKEIWIVADAGSPLLETGADASESGIAALLELARHFSQEGSPVTLRFVAVTGREYGYSGAIQYLMAHSPEPDRVLAVFELSQLATWDRLTASSSLNAQDPINPITKEVRQQMIEEGYYYLRGNWLMNQNLDRSDLVDWIQTQRTRRMGLAESPTRLIQSIQSAGQTLGLTVESRPYAHFSNLPVFLSADIPTVTLSGEGNGLAGSQYDLVGTLRPDKFGKAITVAYLSILKIMGEQP